MNGRNWDRFSQRARNSRKGRGQNAETKMRGYLGGRSRETWIRVKTCAEKRSEVAAWPGVEVRGEGGGECGLRGPHGVVKSIRAGLEPRLPALLTLVRRERHQRD